MQEASRTTRFSPSLLWNIAFYIIALIVVVADQFTKLWIKTTLSVGQSIPETGVFRIVHVRNTGAAFGLFQGQTLSLTIMSLIGAIMLLLYFLIIRNHLNILNNRLSRVAMGLILGGTIGNLIDRMTYGYITDFVTIGFWPSFNVADSSLVIGVIILIFSLLFLHKSTGK
jgi:signal peptidase II